MTTTSGTSTAARISRAGKRGLRWHRPLMILAGVMAVTAVVALAGIFVDPRVLTGVPIWVKPFKFAVSIVIYSVTIAWMLSVLPRPSRVAERAATVIVTMLSVEMIVIVGQVIRGQTSHYNETTPLNALLWETMGAAILVMFGAHFVIAIVALRQRLTDRMAAYAIRLGLGIALVGMLAAVPMLLPGLASTGLASTGLASTGLASTGLASGGQASGGQASGGQALAGGGSGSLAGLAGAHTVGLPDGGPGLPLVGWSTVGGDLRIGHFVGLHGLQVMPLLAIALTAFLGRRLDELTGARLLLVAAGAYAVLTVSLTWQALRGQPLIHPDALTLGVWGALLVATVTAAGVVVARGRRPDLALAA